MKNILKIAKKIIKTINYYFCYILSLYRINKKKQKIRTKIVNNKILNVMFLIQYIPSWNKLEPVYLLMEKSNKFNPIIVCIPNDIKNLNYRENETYLYFKEKYLNVVNSLTKNNKWIDIKALEPDYIFHSRPYNSFMPKQYNSQILSKFSLICNICYGTCLTENGQSVTIDKDYFKNVGIYFASNEDEIKTYNKKFYLGTILTKIQTSYPYGFVGLEFIKKFKTDNVNNVYKKNILWTPRWSTDKFIGGSNFFKYKDVILNLAKKYSDCLFIIRPHPLMFSNFLKTGEMTETEVKYFKKQCKEQSNLELDENKEYGQTFYKSDILIADPSAIVTEFFVTNKPIIYCHSDADFKYLKYAEEMISSCYEANSEEQLKIFLKKLIISDDSKKIERLSISKKYFSKVDKCSSNILYALLNI